ncbi:MAG: hypothetical protein KFH98_05355 [Gemmatimonadetes bacterium]|nr:hypothetical protein [Gemmatimonadota bacterium]
MRLLRLPLLVMACLSGTPAGLAGQGGDRLEDRRSARQIADSVEIAALARTLAGDASSDSARASILYEWVARNIAYDAPSFFAGKDGDDTAEGVYRNRVALCGGFVAMFRRMASEVGLETVSIVGYAKGIDYVFGRSTRKPNHAWLAMYMGGEWRLIDPTWGAGVITGRTFEPRFTWEYFLVKPDELILSHFPERAQWQLVDVPLQRSDFERMHAVPRTLFAVGFSPGQVRTVALTPGVKDFPLIGLMGSHVRVLRAPVAGTIAAAADVMIEVEWPGARDVAMVTDGQWTRLDRTGDRFQGSAAAAGSTLQLVGRTGEDGTPYQTLLHYRVAPGELRTSSK